MRSFRISQSYPTRDLISYLKSSILTEYGSNVFLGIARERRCKDRPSFMNGALDREATEMTQPKNARTTFMGSTCSTPRTCGAKLIGRKSCCHK